MQRSKRHAVGRLLAGTRLQRSSPPDGRESRGKIEERLARWLLMAQDRIGSETLVLTHEFLALMLRVRRAGVTVALQHFGNNAIIQIARGAVTIADRDGLEECANGLYGQPEAEFERLFPNGPPPFSRQRVGVSPRTRSLVQPSSILAV